MEGETGEKNFFQTEKYREKYLKAMRRKEQGLKDIEIENVFGEKIGSKELFDEIDKKINEGLKVSDITADIVEKYKIAKEDAMSAISAVNVFRHQIEQEEEKWENNQNA